MSKNKNVYSFIFSPLPLFILKKSLAFFNPYRKLAKATQAHRVCQNIVNRQFRPSEPYKVLLTDITYLKYIKGQTAYLSTILDRTTNEILAFQLSSHLKIDFVLQTLNQLQENPTVQLTKETIIHSD